MNTIYSIMKANIQKFGDRKFATYRNSNKEIIVKKYIDFYQDTMRMAAFFAGNNIRKQKIALIAENSYEWIVSSVAIMISDNVLVPLDYRLPDDKISELIDFAEVSYIIYSQSVSSKIEKASFVKSKIDIKVLFEESLKNDEEVITETNPTDLCLIMFTSGSTGESKGVMLSQDNLIENVISSYVHANFIEEFNQLSILPMFHIFSLSLDILWAVLMGMSLVLSNGMDEFVKEFKTFEIHRVCLVPMLAEFILRALTTEHSRNLNLAKEEVKNNLLGNDFRRICIGGAYIHPDLRKGLMSFGIEVFCGYGMTEASAVISSEEGTDIKSGSVGEILPCNEVKIVNDEILVKGRNITKGYFKNQEATEEIFDGEWLCTGDIGYKDQNNYLFVIGKKKNLIITDNGENVSPEELEKKFLSYSGIKELIVFQKDNRIEAEIFPDVNYFPNNNEMEMKQYFSKIIQEINKTNPGYKHIQGFSFRFTEFEKTASMKIKREKYYYK